MKQTNPRAEVYRQTRPNKDVSFEELQRVDAFNGKSVDPRFLRNSKLPVDPRVEAEKKKEYLTELERWAALES